MRCHLAKNHGRNSFLCFSRKYSFKRSLTPRISIKIPFVMEIFPEKFIDDDIKKESLISFRSRLAIPAINSLQNLRLNP